jgi:S-DNA-T family DNA segregation ATPase FtsK/SpoIIIE
VEEKDINTLVAAAMEKPAVGEQQAATAPAEEPEAEESYQYQYPGIDLFEKAPEESDPNAQDELKANAQKLVDTLESFGVRTRRSRGMKSSPWRASRSAASPRWQTTSH